MTQRSWGDSITYSHTFKYVLLLILYCSAPGDPLDPSYPNNVPPAINAVLAFVGPITYHHPAGTSGLRMFGIRLSVYNKVDNQPASCNFSILCVYPNTRQWEKYTRLPVKNSLAQVSGEVVGLYQIDNHLSLCLLISEISFLSNISQPASSPFSLISVSSTPVSSTPQNQLQCRGEEPLEQTLTKKL